MSELTKSVLYQAEVVRQRETDADRLEEARARLRVEGELVHHPGLRCAQARDLHHRLTRRSSEIQKLWALLREVRRDLVAEALTCSARTMNGDHEAATAAGNRVQELHARMDAELNQVPTA